MKCSGGWLATAGFGLLTLTGCVPFSERDQLALSPDTAEIVVAADAPKTVRFAASELNGFCRKIFGRSLSEVSTPTAGKVSVFVGNGPWCKAAGIDVGAFKRDAFLLRIEKNRVYVVGRDSENGDIEKTLATGLYWHLEGVERATLFGVYELLERAGVRFYFPGEIGTVVPKADRIVLPRGDELISPAFTARNVYLSGDGVVPDEKNDRDRNSWKTREWLQLRMQTETIPCCHGQRGNMIPERFGKAHPEYFALLKRDGKTLKRDVVEHQRGDCDGQLCHTSGVWDEFYLDAKSYLSGESPKVRNMVCRGNPNTLGWNANFKGGRYIDVMAQDGMAKCLCDKCQKAYDLSSDQFATELIWGNTVRLVNRLKADGFKDFVVTQMAYTPYQPVPKCELPPEICVQVAEMGPWGCAHAGKTESEIAEIRAWSEKLGHKIWMWTYPSKFGEKACPGVPDLAPRACGRYYKATAPYSYGSFVESECEKSIFHYLNYYVFAKVAWNPDVDIEALLDEHFTKMFGAAAPEMAQFYREMEEKWTRRVLFGITESSSRFGSRVCKIASEISIWGDIYSKSERERLKGLFATAAGKLQPGSLEMKRLGFIRREFLGSICEKGECFDRESDPTVARRKYAALGKADNLFPRMETCRHLVVTDPTQAAAVKFPLKGLLKPATRYRMSCIFKMKNVRRDGDHNGGCWFDGYVGQWIWHPKNGPVYDGDCDWTAREFEFETPREIKAERDPYLGFILCRATGEVWVDCLTLQEVKK